MTNNNKINIRTNNKCEIDACALLEAKGYEVLKNGYPDFVAVNWENKEVRFIEVKPKNKKLKPRQIKMKKVFEMMGLKYEVMFISNKGVIDRDDKQDRH
jgi:Holliday junction resolvase-like predicted endonuclease